MKAKVVALIASGLFAAGIWGYSQHMGGHNICRCVSMDEPV